MKLSKGTLLHGGTYKIEDTLGQGSFGITYLAEHVNLGNLDSIKKTIENYETETTHLYCNRNNPDGIDCLSEIN